MTEPATYRERLRLEGAVLAASGALGSVLLLALVAEAGERASSTAVQLAIVAIALALLGPRSVRRWLAEAKPVDAASAPSGQPTPLWMPPLVVVVLVALFVAPGELGVGAVGWDAGLRITLAAMLVGLAQALLLAPIVAADEARRGRRYVRVPGSRAIAGTKLGFLMSKRA